MSLKTEWSIWKNMFRSMTQTFYFWMFIIVGFTGHPWWKGPIIATAFLLFTGRVYIALLLKYESTHLDKPNPFKF